MKSFFGNFYRHLAFFSGHTGFGPTFTLKKSFACDKFLSTLSSFSTLLIQIHHGKSVYYSRLLFQFIQYTCKLFTWLKSLFKAQNILISDNLNFSKFSNSPALAAEPKWRLWSSHESEDKKIFDNNWHVSISLYKGK